MEISTESKKIILESLKESLKYGKQLMINSDEEDVNLGLEIWRKNESIEKAIKEVETFP